MINELLEKNLASLKFSPLKMRLASMSQNKIRVIEGKSLMDTNIEFMGGGGGRIYAEPKEEIENMLRLYEEKYPLYPVLYFYGFGNGALFKDLLKNPRLQFIIVFEPHLELLYELFSRFDFSKELERILIFNLKLFDLEGFTSLTRVFFIYAKSYFLELTSDYYAKFSEEILQINTELAKGFKYNVLLRGNLPVDVLEGLSHYTLNLPKMIARPTLKELLKKRKGLCEEAIIVGTGPSLTKQLPLLKAVQDKALIFAADSSYQILHTWGIKPDFVFMLERTHFTAEFLNNDFGDFDENIIFVIKSLTHPKAIEYLERNGRKFLLISAPDMDFILYSKFQPWNYLFMGPSVSNANHNLAFELGVKKIVLIGQDLAYAPDLTSHPEGYLYGKDDMDEKQEHKENIPLLAYGGKGQVRSSNYWKLFKEHFEYQIFLLSQKGVKTYNATEGGVRIEGSIEVPFKKICKRFFKKSIHKNFPPLKSLSEEKQNEYILKAFYKINLSLKATELFKLKTQNFNSKLYQRHLKLEGLNLDDGVMLLDELYALCDAFSKELENAPQKSAFYSPLNPLITQFKLSLHPLSVLMPQSKEDCFNKALKTVQEYLTLSTIIHKLLEEQGQILNQALLKLAPIIEEKGLKKYLDKIEERLNYG